MRKYYRSYHDRKGHGNRKMLKVIYVFFKNNWSQLSCSWVSSINPHQTWVEERLCRRGNLTEYLATYLYSTRNDKHDYTCTGKTLTLSSSSKRLGHIEHSVSTITSLTKFAVINIIIGMTFMIAGWSPREVDCCNIGAIVAGVLVVSERPRQRRQIHCAHMKKAVMMRTKLEQKKSMRKRPRAVVYMETCCVQLKTKVPVREWELLRGHNSCIGEFLLVGLNSGARMVVG